MATAATIVDDSTTDDATTTADTTATVDTKVANDDTDATTTTSVTDDKTAATTTDDWRSRFAGDDAKLLSFLGRYPTEKAFAEAAKKDREAARNSLKPLGDDPTEEEVAAYRKNFDVPDKPEGYLEKLPEGLVVGEDDKPFVDAFLAKMHEANASPAQTNAALASYYSIIEEQAATEANELAAAKEASSDALKAEWGADYKRNLTAMHAHLDSLPEPVKAAFTHGYGADGVPLGYNPEVLKWITGLALEANPLSTVVPGAGTNQASAVADEMANLEKMMGNRSSDYWKGPKSATLQERYRTLVDAKQKLAARG